MLEPSNRNESESLRTRKLRSRSEILGDDPLGAHRVFWDEITASQCDDYLEILSRAENERPLQVYLQINPLFLVQHLRGGHGRWVMSQKRLGSEYIPDFLIGERSSLGFEWCGVELQSPRSHLFNKNGRPSAQLDEGITQILEWRRWLTNNLSYAQRPRSEEGLGLSGIDGNVPGLIILGRERELSERDKILATQRARENHLTIHTYDWLVRAARKRLVELDK